MFWHVEGKKCCKECFAHETLRDFIANESEETGACQYCGALDAELIEVVSLSGSIENMMEMYSRSEFGGEPLIDLVQGDWEIFSEPLFNSDGAAQLLQDMLLASWDDDSGNPLPDGRESFSRNVGINLVENWDEFLYGERDAPDFSEIVLEDLAPYEATITEGTVLYRARIGWQDENENDERQPWRADAIGPNRKGPPARANFPGDVVLYCADSERTAVAEIRPALGHLVSVCQIKITHDFQILDLSQPANIPDPFTSDLLAYKLEMAGLIRTFAFTLSEPLERNDNPDDYFPSQRLAKFIRDNGFKGIRYPSALYENGTNLVVFDDSVYETGDSKLVKVENVSVKFTDWNWG
jgi:hypothetical protein